MNESSPVSQNPDELLGIAAVEEVHSEPEPLAGDVNTSVHPDETRTDEQIARDETYAIDPYGEDASDEHWKEFDELHRDSPKPPNAEDLYEFSEQDLADRKDAKQWLEDALSYYKEQAKPFTATDSEGDEHIKIPPYGGNWKQHDTADELSRLAEGKYHHSKQTSNSSPLQALETIDTGIFNANNGGAVDDKDATEDLRNTMTQARDVQDFHNGGPQKPKQLTIDELRTFTSKFAELQRRREATIVADGFDPLKNQAEDVFRTKVVPSDRVGEEKALNMAYAGKNERDKAAELRSEIEVHRVFHEETIPVAHEQLTALAETKGVDVDKIGDFEHKDEIYELIEKSDSQVQAAIHTLLIRRQYGDRIDDLKDIRYQSSHDTLWKSHAAEENDRKAERLENWAGVLHDYPLSDAYKERFGLHKGITPEDLIKVEDELAEAEYDKSGSNSSEDLTNKLKRTFLDDIRSGRANMWQ